MHLANLGILICRFSKVKLHPFLISLTTGNGKRDRNQGACTRLAAVERGFWNPQIKPFRLLWLTVRSAYSEDVWGSTDLLTISWVKMNNNCPLPLLIVLSRNFHSRPSLFVCIIQCPLSLCGRGHSGSSRTKRPVVNRCTTTWDYLG